LILVQDERWQCALSMQIERILSFGQGILKIKDLRPK